MVSPKPGEMQFDGAVHPEKCEQVMSLGRGQPLAPAPWSPVHEMVADVARTDPDRIAVCADGGVLGYGALVAWGDRIADRLAAAGVGRDSRVGVLTAPSTAMVAAVFGILRSGAAYVPVDPAQRDRRIADVLADANVSAAVVTGTAGTRLAGLGLPLIQVEDSAHGPDTIGRGAAVSPSDVAYLIYTSGSTGEPKGVVIEHGQLTDSTLARLQVYPDAPVFLLVSPLAFDSSVAGLWGTLAAGGTLVVAGSDDVRDPERLVELVRQYDVTRTLCVPSLYSVVLDAAERAGMSRLSSLEEVVVAGEPLPEALLERHFAVHPGPVALINEYGPTEATVWASYRRFDAPGPVSIGGPIPGTLLYVLDEQRRRVPQGTEGELYIGGRGVARGYFGRPEATAAAFVGDPFAGTPGARMYCTGDRVRWTGEGTLEFIGRTDHQVKIRGHRVELGAVEAALREMPGVRDAVVVPDSARTRLTGFVLAEPAAVDSVRTHLVQQLPAGTIPVRIEPVDGFPRTFSGKLDRARLQAAADGPVPAAPAPGTGSAPGEGTAARVAAAWAEVLEIAEVPLDTNFFDAGGHSLALFKLQDALERHTGTRLSVVTLFRHTTVTAQAVLIDGGGGDARVGESAPARQKAAARRRAARTPSVAHEPANHVTALRMETWLHCTVARPDAPRRLICFPHAGGSASFFREWETGLPGIEVHAVRYPGRAERIDEPEPTDLRRLAAEIAEVLVSLADRPLELFGHSMGAVVALETARSLEALGVRPAHLFASGSRNAPYPPTEDSSAGDGHGAGLVPGRLVDLGGTDPELAADPLFQELVLPYVLSDGRMFRAYRNPAAPRLRCPVTTIVGDRDDDADRRPWPDLTEGPFREHVVPGNHFYLTADPPYWLLLEAPGAVGATATQEDPSAS
jgi:amino acid adenylation domain-containing protein